MEALKTLLKTYADTNEVVTQKFYQGLCEKALERIKDLEDKWDRLDATNTRMAIEFQERIEKLKAEIAVRPAKPLMGEARSRLLKAMDNSAHVDDAIDKWNEFKKRIKELEAVILTSKICLDRGENIEPESIAHQEFEQALKG